MVVTSYGIYMENKPIEMDEFFNRDTLNIFTDGSVMRRGKAYGIIGVCGNDIVFEDIREMSEGTINVLELKGIRQALGYMKMYSSQFKNVNIFCDSYYAVNMLKSTVFSWRFDGYQYITRDNKIAPNQDLIIEIENILLSMITNNPNLNLYWCPAHVVMSHEEMLKSRNKFCKFNDIRGKVDLNFTRYIATMNSLIDSKVQQASRHYSGKKYIDPISFFFTEIKM